MDLNDSKKMNSERTPLFLMANLGAEVSRVFSLSDKGDKENALRASGRAKAIITDLYKYEEMLPRKQELEKIIDIIDSKFSDIGINVQNSDVLDYFNHFALKLMSSDRR